MHGAPSSCSSRISFSATFLPVKRLFPRYTVAYVPSPKSNIFLYVSNFPKPISLREARLFLRVNGFCSAGVLFNLSITSSGNFISGGSDNRF